MQNNQIPNPNEIPMVQIPDWNLEFGTSFVIGACELGFNL